MTEGIRKGAGAKRLVLCWAVAFAQCLAPWSVGAPMSDDLRVVINGLEKQTQEIEALRDAVLAKIPVAKATDRSMGLLEIQMPCFVDAANVTVNIARKDGKWTEGWAVGYTRHSSRVEVKAETWSGTDVELKLRIHLMPQEFRTDRHTAGPYKNAYTTPDGIVRYRDGEALPMDCEIQCALGRRTAKARVLNPAGGPFREAGDDVTCRWVAADRPVCEPYPANGAFTSLYEDAGQIADRGRFAYEQIRAMEIQMRTGIPYAIAISNITRTPLTWLDPEGKVKRPQPGSPAAHKTLVPTLDDLEGQPLLMDVQKSSAQKAAESEAKRVASGKQLKGLAEMSEYLAGVKGRIEAWQSGTMALPPLQVGDVSTDDPQFVPSMGPLSLEATTEGVNRLPDTVGANGAPLWAYVKGWRFLGPLTPMDFDTCSPYLPDIVPAIGSCLIVQTNRFPWGPKNYYVGDGLSPWTGMPFDPRSGYTLPPIYSRANMVWSVRNGVLYGACMASLVVESPRDVTVWAAAGCPVRGTVWVENQLIWTSGRKEDLSNQGMMQQFKMPLKKGPNRVVVRLDTYHQELGLTMRICVQGNPRTAEQVAKDEAAEKAAYAKVGRPYDRLCAGEMDFARQFPDCRPPLAWDLSKDINVLWRTYLPESRGGVLIVGERLFVTQEPFSLVCLNKADGKELWRQNMDPIELLCPEIWEKEKAQVDEFDKLDVKPVPTAEESARRKTLLKEREELMKTVVPKRPPVRQCISSEAAQMKRKFEYGGGHTFAKPVSDGKHVWYKMAGGHDVMLACYDLDGRRKWARIYDKTRGGDGSSIPGLVLHGNKIIWQVARYGTGPATNPNANDDDENVVTTSSATEYMNNQRRYSLMAVNKDTGEPIWESNAYPGEAFGRRFDADCVVQPGLMRLANGTETLDVVIHTAVGVVLRAEDGKELMRYCGGYSNLGVPIEDGKGTFFFSNATIQGVKFRLVDRDTITTRVMFRRDAFHEIGKKLCARDGLLNGDRLYVMQKRLSVYDAQTGLIDAKAPSELWPYQCETQVYMPSIVTGNDVLYVASTTDGGTLPGAMSAVLCAPDRDPVVLARNWMPGSGMASHPVCEGDRMYARTQKEVLCIGYTGDDGRRYEAEVLAKTVLAHKLPPAVPENDPAPIPIPAKVPNRSVANEHMAWRMQPGGMVGCFLVTEPMPTAGSSWLTELFCGKARPKAGERFHAEMANSEFVQGENRVKVRGVMLGAVLAEGYGNAGGGLVTEAQAFGLKYDMGLVHCGQPGTLCMWRANLGFDRTSTWRFTSGRGTGVRAWLDGVEIKDGQRVRVPMGFYDFIVTTEAKGDEDLKGAFKPVFWPAETPEAEQAARKSLVGALRPLLEKVPKDVKDPEVTKLFKAVM